MRTIKEVAEEFKVSVKTVRRWIKAGRLKAIKIDGTIRINEEEFNRLIGKIKGGDE